ncbi:hypothetical protein PYW08_000520 [Mythimna loreyi]|uniref:Uncharacterized protein n=1 Tax=Mythimna loreyi TaxID=667449 RepID=A0ACC2RCP9_9NEOP|nr:hypothetical protein PYW08_000520 [Mythimna loreyi]
MAKQRLIYFYAAQWSLDTVKSSMPPKPFLRSWGGSNDLLSCEHHPKYQNNPFQYQSLKPCLTQLYFDIQETEWKNYNTETNETNNKTARDDKSISDKIKKIKDVI